MQYNSRLSLVYTMVVFYSENSFLINECIMHSHTQIKRFTGFLFKSALDFILNKYVAHITTHYIGLVSVVRFFFYYYLQTTIYNLINFIKQKIKIKIFKTFLSTNCYFTQYSAHYNQLERTKKKLLLLFHRHPLPRMKHSFIFIFHIIFFPLTFFYFIIHYTPCV